MGAGSAVSIGQVGGLVEKKAPRSLISAGSRRDTVRAERRRVCLRPSVGLPGGREPVGVQRACAELRDPPGEPAQGRS